MCLLSVFWHFCSFRNMCFSTDKHQINTKGKHLNCFLQAC
nr:MAG TPA: hypothetical protein [Caudoviricetes sp.]